MGGGGKSHGADQSALFPMANQLYSESQPITKLTLGQAQEALTTGGTAARLPSITAASAASSRALSEVVRSIREDSAARGMANSPFTRGQIGQQLMEGRQQVANIGPQAAQQAGAAGQDVFGALMSALGSTRSGRTQGKNTSVL